jgi:hypothetical protein
MRPFVNKEVLILVKLSWNSVSISRMQTADASMGQMQDNFLNWTRTVRIKPLDKFQYLLRIGNFCPGDVNVNMLKLWVRQSH